MALPSPQPVDHNPLDQLVKNSFSVRSVSLFATGTICVLWDVHECPIPASLKVRDVFNNIKKVLRNNGFFGPVDIKPYVNLLNMDLLEAFETIPVSFLPGDRGVRLDYYLTHFFNHAIDNGGFRPFTLVLILGDISGLDELFRAINILQSRLRFKVLIAQPPRGSVLSLTEIGLCNGLLAGQDLLIQNSVVMGRSAPEQENIALLMDDVQRIRRELTSSIPVTVTENQAKFAYNLSKELIGIRTPPTEKKTCGGVSIEPEPMFSVALCRHQFGVEWMKQHIEVRLIEGDVPRCPHYGCKSILTLKSCAHLLTPKLKEMWEHRIKEDSIPVCERFHCPNPRCWALMSKTELFESTEDGVRRCCFKCRKPFCINCKVLWHSNLSCKEYKTLGQNPKTISRQCKKCQHMIKQTHKTTNITCRCGYTFCFKCGAQWKLGGCRHHNVADAFILIMIFILLIIIRRV
ncbi:unnamed protein product [Arabidopsis halleri]